MGAHLSPPGIFVGAGDFCDCPRGAEGRRWFDAGFRVLPELAEAIQGCDFCDPCSGVDFRKTRPFTYHLRGTVLLQYVHKEVP